MSEEAGKTLILPGEPEESDLVAYVKMVQQGADWLEKNIAGHLSQHYQTQLPNSLLPVQKGESTQYFALHADDSAHLKNIKTLLNFIKRAKKTAQLMENLEGDIGAFRKLKEGGKLLLMLKDLLADLMELDIKADLNIIKPFLQGNYQNFQEAFQDALPSLEQNLGLKKGALTSEDIELGKIFQGTDQPTDDYYQFVTDTIEKMKKAIVEHAQDVQLELQSGKRFYQYSRKKSAKDPKTENTKALLNTLTHLQDITSLLAGYNANPQKKTGAMLKLAYKLFGELAKIKSDAEEVDFIMAKESLGEAYDDVMHRLYQVLEYFALSTDLFEAQVGLEPGLCMDMLEPIYDVYFLGTNKHHPITLQKKRNDDRQRMITDNTERIKSLEQKQSLIEEQIKKPIYNNSSEQTKTHLCSERGQLTLQYAIKTLSIKQDKNIIQQFAQQFLGFEFDRDSLDEPTWNVLTVVTAIAYSKVGDERSQFIRLMKDKLYPHLQEDPNDYQSNPLAKTTPKIIFSELKTLQENVIPQFQEQLITLKDQTANLQEHQQHGEKKLMELKAKYPPPPIEQAPPHVVEAPTAIKAEKKPWWKVALDMMINFFQNIKNGAISTYQAIKRKLYPPMEKIKTGKGGRDSIMSDDQNLAQLTEELEKAAHELQENHEQKASNSSNTALPMHRSDLEQELLQILLDIKSNLSNDALKIPAQVSFHKTPIDEGVKNLRERLTSLNEKSDKTLPELLAIANDCIDITQQQGLDAAPQGRSKDVHNLYLAANAVLRGFLEENQHAMTDETQQSREMGKN